MNAVKGNMLEHQNEGLEKSENATPRLHESWRNRLQEQFSSEHMTSLKKFLTSEIRAGKKIFPRGDQYFAALDACEFENVRVVILGQDPYHGPGQAHGLSFSVPVGVRPPPSLLNIFKELKADVGFEIPDHGNLQSWAKRGVLLLNAVLTVEESRAASHQKRGWEQFTDAVIHKLAEEREGLVFILWGAYAQKKGAFIDRKKHLVIESVHPSPLSAHRGFLGSKPFSQTNKYLVDHGQKPIDWSLPKRSELKADA